VTSSAKPLRLLIAGGGTGGHVLPAVAVLEELQSRRVPVDALWVGGYKGVERDIASSRGIDFLPIQTGKLRRYASIQTLTDAFRLPVGVVQGAWYTRRFGPDVIYSTGGAVSVPTVVGHALSARARVVAPSPILTHEQTAQVGIANRTVARFATTFAAGFEQTAEAARTYHANVVVTGNPVRASLRSGDRERGRAWAGFTDSLPVVYVTGGALGASPLNQRIEPNLPRLLEVSQVLHQVGPTRANDDFARLSRLREQLPAPLQGRYAVHEFVRDELPDVFAMADLVVGRAGAGTVSELGFLGLPAVLMPLPGTWGDEQRKNARVLSAVGGAVVLEQADTDAQRLGDEIIAILQDPPRRRKMAEGAKSTSRPDAAARLVEELLSLAGWDSGDR
jgi:UDP-N-acetylglucosamine--N-acetylmuramyl-(pentapeptide) pyrophosphoryl-undecaprenol N-acetylglucosamine transferase